MYDDEQKKCVDIVEGMSEEISGMSLSRANIEKGYWRIDSNSKDIRECPVSDACTGGNSTSYCLDGHEGPYCKLCASGYFMTPFGICNTCEETAIDIAMTILAFVALVVIVCTISALLVKRRKKQRQSERASSGETADPNKLTMTKRLKNGAKIIFNGVQVSATK
jgi:hypothetical protein